MIDDTYGSQDKYLMNEFKQKWITNLNLNYKSIFEQHPFMLEKIGGTWPIVVISCQTLF